ncbi:DUF4956 domain-containing protein [Schleiferiaceae bacterium]|jgi:hypothetical protein|nr:DUF4956 domain-containing protein [Schleiferiaceae bacterium]MDA8819449.1 DUF4956 domain-containing protein [Schleiferiaceae bacterium]MDB2473553.1 DUF4956 domain-containing protein [Schleiferiaceae bacterium]MDB3991579.1 DUF4956 domain-containing protein [Schleiferiaceae bacterium]
MSELLHISTTMFFKFALMVVYNLIQLGIVSRHNRTTRTNVSSFFIIAVVVFFLSYVLSTFEMQIGLAIGMFAIFGIIRYRTETLRPQEMTYLFASLGIAVINALSSEAISFAELILINATVLACIYILEKFLLDKPEEEPKPTTKKVTVVVATKDLTKDYVDNRVKELAETLGVTVVKFHISKVDHAEGTAQINVIYEI